MNTTRIAWLVLMAAGFVLPGAASAQTLADSFSLVSVAPDGTTPGNANSAEAAISGDGRFVAFSSAASNLVANDTNNSLDVFVRDRVANTTTRVSVTSAGEERSGDSELPRITPDGRFVVFQSRAPLVADRVCAPGDALCRDIYLHDRNTATTTRISLSALGEQSNGASFNASVSGDGRYVVFLSYATNLVAGDTNAYTDVFLRDRQTGTTTRVSTDAAGNQSPHISAAPHISADGRLLLYTQHRDIAQEYCDTPNCSVVILRDLQAGTLTELVNLLPPSNTTVVYGGEVAGLSADGNVIVIRERGLDQPLGGMPLAFGRHVILDRQTGRVTNTKIGGWRHNLSADGRVLSVGAADILNRVNGIVESVPLALVNLIRMGPFSLSASGRFVAFHAAQNSAIPDPPVQIWVYDRDPDADSLPSAWEGTFGLDPFNAADAALDGDGDGLTNAQEFQRGSHPAATFTRYFAEGAANEFFTTRFALLNLEDTDARVVLRFLGKNGQTSSAAHTVKGKTRVTVFIDANGEAPTNDFATVVESDRPVVADRTMTWDSTRYGGHTETALTAPSTTWYLAEGATHGSFALFYLLQNPNPTPATATITYQRLAPQPPIVKTYDVPANGRLTIAVDDEGPELAATDVAASIASDLPIVVERAMYSTLPGQPPFAAGHGGAGVTAPALRWFLAEGATGSFFDLFVLVSNPATTASEITVTYLLPTGARFTKTYTVGPQNRLTIPVQDQDPRLDNTPVSVIVESTNNQPVVVERAMWWPKGRWHEAHVVAGATETGTRWAVAEAETEFVPFAFGGLLAETYLLIANTSPRAGVATVTLYDDNGVRTGFQVNLPASSRVSVPLADTLFRGWGMSRVGALVESDGVDIVVERAMYRTANSLTWSWGTASLGTKLQ